MEPMRRQSRGPRVARGTVAASVATFVALLCHVSGGGQVPGVFGIAVPLALSFVVCTTLAGRRLSPVRLGLAVAVSQLSFHTLFVLGSYRSGAAGHIHGAPPLLTGEVSAQIVAAPIATADAAMWVGHFVAAVATTALLHRGERTVTVLRDLAVRCVAWVRSRARIVAAVAGPASVRRIPALIVADMLPVSAVIAESTRRRGPPLAAS